MPSTTKMMKKGPEEKPVISTTTQLHNRHLSSYARAAVEIAMMLINMNLSRQYSMVDMNGQRMPLSSTTGICLHMPGLQRRWLIQDWPQQPHKTMLINNHSRHYSIVHTTDGSQPRPTPLEITPLISNAVFLLIRETHGLNKFPLNSAAVHRAATLFSQKPSREITPSSQLHTSMFTARIPYIVNSLFASPKMDTRPPFQSMSLSKPSEGLTICRNHGKGSHFFLRTRILDVVDSSQGCW